MTPLTAERFTHLPQNPAGVVTTVERDLRACIRLLAQLLEEHDRRPGGVRGGMGRP